MSAFAGKKKQRGPLDEQEKHFDYRKADTNVPLMYHDEFAGDFEVPHLHMRIACGVCGEANDVIICRIHDQMWAKFYCDERATDIQRRKLGIDEFCLNKCRVGGPIELPNNFGAERR
jgi:hypothetical protein